MNSDPRDVVWKCPSCRKRHYTSKVYYSPSPGYSCPSCGTNVGSPLSHRDWLAAFAYRSGGWGCAMFLFLPLFFVFTVILRIDLGKESARSHVLVFFGCLLTPIALQYVLRILLPLSTRD